MAIRSIACIETRKLNLIDVVSGTNWSVQQVTTLSTGKPPYSNVAVTFHSGTGFNQLHYCYTYATTDPWNVGDVYDSLHDNHSGWQTIQVTGPTGKAPKAPKALGNPSIVVYSGQTHYCYRDAGGIIWDVVQDGNSWTPQQVTGPGGQASTAPLAADDPFVIVWSGAGYNQMHYCYRDKDGAIWDVQWSGSSWVPTQVTGAGGKIPGAPAADAGPFVCIYSGSGFNQMHYCYRDKTGRVQDAVWNGGAWVLQTI